MTTLSLSDRMIIQKRDALLQVRRDGVARARVAYQPATSAMLSWFNSLDPRVSCPVAFELASLPQPLHGIAYVIGLALHGRSDHNPHSRARHPAV